MVKISHYDDISIKDALKFNQNFAKIFINGRLVWKTKNMVVASGRKYVAQRLFNIYHPSDNDYRNFIVSHFGIGSGGSTINADGSIALIGPDICDIDNNIPIQLDPGNSLYLTTPSGTQYAAKPITVDGSLQIIENDNIPCPGNNRTIVLCTCVINRQEPTNLNPGEAVKVDEACLYYSDGTVTQTFARITFPPKYIEQSTEFMIEWYIIC